MPLPDPVIEGGARGLVPVPPSKKTKLFSNIDAIDSGHAEGRADQGRRSAVARPT